MAAKGVLYAIMIELLSWDSTFFGLPVGRLSADAPPAELPNYLSCAKSNGIQLLYWMPPRDSISDIIRQAYRQAYVQEQVIFGKELAEAAKEPIANPEMAYRIRPQSKPDEEIISLAIEAGGKSRFRVDSRFSPERFEAMYRIWIDRGCRGENGTLVMCAHDRGGSLAGFVLLSPRDGRCEVELIAVATNHRRKGVGKGLLQSAEQWARNSRCHHMSIVTQADNHEARRLYASAGYAVIASRDCFHFWLKDG